MIKRSQSLVFEHPACRYTQYVLGLIHSAGSVEISHHSCPDVPQLFRLDNNNENEDDLGKKDVANNKHISNNTFLSSSSSSLLSKSNISSEQRMMESNSFLKEAISAANRRSASPLSPTATKKSRDILEYVTFWLPRYEGCSMYILYCPFWGCFLIT